MKTNGKNHFNNDNIGNGKLRNGRPASESGSSSGSTSRSGYPSRSGLFSVRNAAIAGALIFAFAAYAIIGYAAEPGSTADPIALKSYVDSKLEALETRLTTMIQSAAQTQPAASGQADSGGDVAALASRIRELEIAVATLKDENAGLRQNTAPIPVSDGEDLNLESSTGSVFSSERFSVVEVTAGQRIIFGAGAEMVLRTGKASAIRGELGAPIDLITGADLEAGESVPINHLILSPRNDNRGVRISEDAWVLIKGTFELR